MTKEFYPEQFELWYDDFSAVAPGLTCDSVELEILASKLNRWIRKAIANN